ncbi:MAG: 50S ribosomal protein L24 [Candidatus Marinimicrobia bacterium]|nr:50S ribosomal protein L24 [Candidatus Neomarinimicrobiota bacterium]
MLKKNDQVLIISGSQASRKDNKGKVLKALPKQNKVIVEGMNLVKRHTKPSQKHSQGGIMEFSAPIHISNVMLICGKCKTPTRVKHKILDDGSKVRVCSHCGEIT